MDFNFSLFVKILPQLWQGFLMTLLLSVLGMFFATIIGMFVGIARLSKSRWLTIPTTLYVEIVRGTPLMLQILIIYYALPSIGINLDKIPAGVFALAFCYGAYISEIFRAGIQSIERGQVEAARSIGMTTTQAMRYVILPQAIRRILPPLTNDFVAMLKDSSLVAIIALFELTTTARYISTSSGNVFTPYIGAALFYLLITIPVSRLVVLLEKKLGVGQ
ncbi:MAG: amino acid ABC transporter permease [Coprothermobacterota bacterium]|jgi:polar amino acid transport system permease protein|nr:amino acid ABC transporter permease [Coprothermobacterota bacterium]